MRISDWSSDVCSSDLLPFVFRVHDAHGAARFTEAALVDRDHVIACVIEALDETAVRGRGFTRAAVTVTLQQIGRASCRERVCQYVEISVVAVSLKKQTIVESRASEDTKKKNNY